MINEQQVDTTDEYQPRYKLILGDSVKVLEELPDESVDLIITDPAYESLEKHRAKGTTTRLKQSKGSSSEWFDIFKNERYAELFPQLYRVLRQNAHLYVFCDVETMFVIKPVAQQFGFTFWAPIVWDKESIGMGYHYRSQYEMILFLEKGKLMLRDLSMGNIFRVKRVSGGYPTEKPVEAIARLISQSGAPGEVVLDPFSGSGATGVAAVQAGLSYIGIDTSKKAHELAKGRLEEAGAVQSDEIRAESKDGQVPLF